MSEDMVHSTDETVDSSVRSPKQGEPLHTPGMLHTFLVTTSYHDLSGRNVFADESGIEIDPFGAANAARIVHCWNLHDELVEALEMLVEAVTNDPEDTMDEVHNARSVLKKARGEE